LLCCCCCCLCILTVVFDSCLFLVLCFICTWYFDWTICIDFIFLKIFFIFYLSILFIFNFCVNGRESGWNRIDWQRSLFCLFDRIFVFRSCHVNICNSIHAHHCDCDCDCDCNSCLCNYHTNT
jgi:hypothetical protein